MKRFFLFSLFATAAVAVIIAAAQRLGSFPDTLASQREHPAALYGAKRFADLAPEKQLAYLATRPPTFEEKIRPKGKNERDAEALAAFAITRPGEYADSFPVEKDSKTLAAEAEAVFAITQPSEYQRILDSEKTNEQLEVEKFNAWAITHPAEFAQTIQPLKNARDLAQEAEATELITQPPGIPIDVTRLPLE